MGPRVRTRVLACSRHDPATRTHLRPRSRCFGLRARFRAEERSVLHACDVSPSCGSPRRVGDVSPRTGWNVSSRTRCDLPSRAGRHVPARAGRHVPPGRGGGFRGRGSEPELPVHARRNVSEQRWPVHVRGAGELPLHAAALRRARSRARDRGRERGFRRKCNAGCGTPPTASGVYRPLTPGTWCSNFPIGSASRSSLHDRGRVIGGPRSWPRLTPRRRRGATSAWDPRCRLRASARSRGGGGGTRGCR